MRLAISAILILILSASSTLAQTGGNVGYGQQNGRARAEQNERAKRQLTREEMPPNDSTMFVDASILINVKANEFVAIFGVAEEAETVEACQARMDATIAGFTESLRPLGIAPESVFVDFTAQTKVYAYRIEGNVAREQLTGFELKKTVSVRYRDHAIIDKLVIAASKSKVYDLIKVDYLVTDLAPVNDRLAEAAAAVIKSKVARNERLLGIKLKPMPTIFIDRTSAYFPTEMYDSYVSGESETVTPNFDRDRTTVQALRKSRTFFYHPLDADGFDRVIDPVILEPVVQFTLYLKVKYEVAQTKP